jgi:hypothetical protein
VEAASDSAAGQPDAGVVAPRSRMGLLWPKRILGGQGWVTS